MIGMTAVQYHFCIGLLCQSCFAQSFDFLEATIETLEKGK